MLCAPEDSRDEARLRGMGAMEEGPRALRPVEAAKRAEIFRVKELPDRREVPGYPAKD